MWIFIIVIASIILRCNSQTYYLYLPSKNVGNVQISTVPLSSWTAKAFWDGNNYNNTGWSLLEIETNSQAQDNFQAYAAGYLEGKLTKNLISLHLLNTIGNFCKDTVGSVSKCNKVINYLTANFYWIKTQIAANKADPYWYQVNLIFIQFQGLYNGYYGYDVFDQNQNIFDQINQNPKSYLQMLALQLYADMEELMDSLDKKAYRFGSGSCSALIKVLNNNTDLYVSHVSWLDYETMLRILKHFKLNYRINGKNSTLIPGSEVSFSGYPGILVSIDDYYILKSKLVVMETTIGNGNTDLWKFVTPQSNFYWIRNLVANRLATSGPNWAKWFSMFNSGTYNDEWMIVDYNMFTPGMPLKNGLLTVLDQIPGTVTWNDQTNILRAQAYFASYNIPFYSNIYMNNGLNDVYLEYGDFFSYEKTARAQIFKRDQSQVVNIDSMIKLMRSNNFTKDPLSRCDCKPPYSAVNAISSRSDLNKPKGKYPFEDLGYQSNGGTDMKLTNKNMVQTFQFIAIYGPTYDNQDITPFQWSKSGFTKNTNYFGQPDKFTFKPFNVTWKL